ncbi:hypothetical protein M9H77_31064 [Catharanthus roseus]|uniref:Uncharacterized protein n=1 Tax=Catharanthus roseus TaxID=4058 RepID=A0ACB9ZZ09_CATRO|nr:hypothetical protein M9H77_31064 [Catharanthus roseus]
MVDTLGSIKDTTELEALRSRLENFWADVIEVKGELKKFAGNSESTWRNMELSQTKLVTLMSMPSRLIKDLDFPIVVAYVAMHDEDEDIVSDRQIDKGNDMAGCNQICAERVVNDEEVFQCVQFYRSLRRSARNRPSAARIIKGLRSARIRRRETSKDFIKSVVNVTVINCLSTLLTYAERLKHNGKARIWYLLTWFQVEVLGKDSPLDKLYRYFLVENEYGGNFISCEKVDSIDRYAYVFKLFISDDNIARANVLRNLGYYIDSSDGQKYGRLQQSYEGLMIEKDSKAWGEWEQSIILI